MTGWANPALKPTSKIVGAIKTIAREIGIRSISPVIKPLL
jgi:hypothetical protein